MADVRNGKIDLPIERRDSSVEPTFVIDCVKDAQDAPSPRSNPLKSRGLRTSPTPPDR